MEAGKLAREMQSVKYNVLDLDVINKASVVAEFSFFSKFFFDLPQILHCRESCLCERLLWVVLYTHFRLADTKLQFGTEHPSS